ncbi:alpha/beta hydrolase [Duganella sp. HH101]|uniref:alpha/beta hydrolase n=1 Tax=Duganella sp. HH101 TaxID=1781066 RepID=UPI0008741FD3|nr:alpha/beta fold hydrolase [Duganella sp. HH101]OFA00485.1 alpha/beta hydrolase family protein [Duganella sp. HH101]
MKLILAMMAVLLSGCAMQIGEGSIVRPDRAGAVPPPGRLGDGGATTYKLAPLTLAADDAQLAGVSASGDGNALTVLYFGGNGFHLDQHGDHVLAAVAPCRADVVMIDYRGYGRSTGVPTIAALKADALREFDLVNGQAPGRVIVHGQSLGSFIAAYVAQQRPAVRGLVLESTTTNARDWANNMMPWYVWPFVRVELSESLKGIDNVAAASGYAGPALVLEGSDDDVTPPRLAQKVYDALPTPSKRMVMVPGAGHNGVLSSAAVRPAYCEFVRQLAAK